MKLGPVTKLDKRNKTTSKFLDNLSQSGRRIPDVQSAKLIFSLTITFYLTRTENRNKI